MKYYYGKYQNRGKVCTFKGYVPGGNVVTVKRITAPSAKLEKGIFGGLAGNMGKASAAVQHSTMLLKGFGKLAEIAPKLGPAMGLFGVAFSTFSAFTKPTAQDILDKVNDAIGKLTTEMNNRLDEMQGYVEQKTMNLEKDLVSREYKSLFHLWINCLKEVTKEEVNECQEDAAKTIMAARPKFAIFSDKVQANEMPSVYDIKRIETSLVVFRDYVLLNLACLSALIATLKDEPSQHAKYERYAKDLNADIEWCAKYARNAVSIIQRMHTRGDYCEETMKCTKLSELKEGWFLGVHTADNLKCHCVFDRADLSTQTCEYYILIRRDGKRGLAGYHYFFAPTSNREAALKFKAKKLIEEKRVPFINALKNVITNYWDNEILDVVSDWESLKVEGISSDQMTTDEEVQMRRQAMVLSDNFDRRQKQVEYEMAVELDMLYDTRGNNNQGYYEDEQRIYGRRASNNLDYYYNKYD
ncbi:MAG: hypothetical protein AAFY76_09360 [Cyanobacteria bacterium J06649_11]